MNEACKQTTGSEQFARQRSEQPRAECSGLKRIRRVGLQTCSENSAALQSDMQTLTNYGTVNL